jgi:hypothetical protein
MSRWTRLALTGSRPADRRSRLRSAAIRRYALGRPSIDQTPNIGRPFRIPGTGLGTSSGTAASGSGERDSKVFFTRTFALEAGCGKALREARSGMILTYQKTAVAAKRTRFEVGRKAQAMSLGL